jgi:hypothetical protein
MKTYVLQVIFTETKEKDGITKHHVARRVSYILHDHTNLYTNRATAYACRFNFPSEF